MPTETLRPNAVGTYSQFPLNNPNAGIPHYQNVDDESPDGDATLIATDETTPTKLDTYNLPATNIPDGATINNITLHINARREATLYPCTPLNRPILRTHATTYYGDDQGATDDYADYSHIWTTNPNTGNAWTKDEINALEIGVEGASCRRLVASLWWWTYLRVTQVYVVIDYTIPVPPAKPLIDKPLVNPILVNIPCVR